MRILIDIYQWMQDSLRRRFPELTEDPEPMTKTADKAGATPRRDPYRLYTITAYHKDFPGVVLLCCVKNHPELDIPGNPRFVLYAKESPLGEESKLIDIGMADPVALLVRHGEAGYRFTDRSAGLQKLIDQTVFSGEAGRFAHLLTRHELSPQTWTAPQANGAGKDTPPDKAGGTGGQQHLNQRAGTSPTA